MYYVSTYIHIYLHLIDTELVNVLDSSDTVTVSGGEFTVSIQGGMPKIYHPVSDAADVEREWLTEEEEEEEEEEEGEGEGIGDAGQQDTDHTSGYIATVLGLASLGHSE